MTPFHLVYGEVVVSVDIRMSSAWVKAYDEDNVEKRLLELDLIGEARYRVAAQLRVYK